MINAHKLYADLFTEDGFKVDPTDLPGSYDSCYRRHRALEQIYKSVFPDDGYELYNAQIKKIKKLYASLIAKFGVEHVIESVKTSAAGERATYTGFSVPQFIQKGDIKGLVVSEEDMASLDRGECYSIHGIWGTINGPFKEGDIKWEFMESGKSIVKFKEFSYFLRQKGSDLCKVGKSNNCIKRYQQISCANPCIQFEFMTSTPENLIHNRLYQRKLNWRHEWFKVSQEEAEKLKEFCLEYGNSNAVLECP